MIVREYKTVYQSPVMLSTPNKTNIGRFGVKRRLCLGGDYPLCCFSPNLYAGKARAIGVGKKFGCAESLHKILVHVEFKVGDSVSYRIDFFKTTRRCQHPGRPPE